MPEENGHDKPRVTRALLKELAKEVPGGQSQLVPLATKNDPFLSGTEGQRAQGEWFAKLWEEFDYPEGKHVRDIHYDIATKLSYTYYKHDGTPYLHNKASYGYMVAASKAARHLGLVSDKLKDMRSDPLLEYAQMRAWEEDREPDFDLEELSFTDWDMPEISISSPANFDVDDGIARGEVSGYEYHPSDQPVHLEVWVEKTKAQAPLQGVCRYHDANLQWGDGFFGIEVCRGLVNRAHKLEKPVRVLYLCDYDPAGIQMPISMARQVEYILSEAEENSLDIKIEVLAVTTDQMVDMNLPRPPFEVEQGEGHKWQRTRNENFEKQLGEGGTELNAIDDANLASLVNRRLRAYRDEELRHAVAAAEEEAQEALDEAIEEAVGEFTGELRGLTAHQREVVARYEERVAELNRQMTEELEPTKVRSEEIRAEIETRLQNLGPNLPGYPESEGAEGEDEDFYLFDSAREYVEQMGYYRRRQGKGGEWEAIADAIRGNLE